jgi:hypothetical protein
MADVDQMLQGDDGVQELRAELTLATGSLVPLEEQAPGRSANAKTATRKVFAIGPMLLATAWTRTSAPSFITLSFGRLALRQV